MKHPNIYLPIFTLFFGVTHDDSGLRNGVSIDAPGPYGADQSLHMMDGILSWISIIAVSAVLGGAIILLLLRVERLKVVRKNLKELSHGTHLKKVIAITLLVIIIGLLAWNTFLRQNATSVNMQGQALDGPTFIVKGQVTQKQTSCSSETLGTDGMIRRGGGICDGGNSLEIEGIRVSTGGGALVDHPPKYDSDIESIHAGDKVEVRYAKDKSGYASTNCKTCYVKKL